MDTDRQSLLSALKQRVRRAGTYLVKLQLAGKQLKVAPLLAADAERVRNAFARDGAAPTPSDLGQQEAGQTSILVAWDEERPLGIAFINWGGPRDPSMASRWGGTPEIFRVFVAPRYRSAGIGTLLLDRCRAMVAERKYARVAVGVHEPNVRARALYLRLGFVEDAVPYFDEYDVTNPDGSVVPVRMKTNFLVKDIEARR